MANKITFDAFQLMETSKTLQTNADAVGAASRAFPTSVDAGDSAQLANDIVSGMATWAAMLAEVHTAIADITRKVANETMSNEAEAVTQLDKIDAAIDPFA